MARREIKQERAHETRERILNGAAAAFAESGFAGATVAEILKRSQVTKGALYFHFETKEEVADAVLAANGVQMRALAENIPTDGAQRLIDLSYLVCDALATSVVFQAAARLAIERESYGPDRPESFRMWETLVRVELNLLNARGVVRVPLDSARLARMLTAGLVGLHLAAHAANDETRLHDDITFFWRQILPLLLTDEALTTIELKEPQHA